MTAWIGTRLFGAAAGTVAALLLAGTLLLGVEARQGRTDAMLLATVVAAQAALARLYLAGAPAAGERPATPWLFWLALGAGILLKGPIILLTAGGTILGLAAADRSRGWLRRLRPWPGAVSTAALVLPWVVAIFLVSGGAFFAESIGNDLLAKVGQGQESHGGAPGYHLLSWLIGFWPFAPLLIAAAPAIWRRRREPAVRFCLAWIVPTLVVFELVVTKLPHYTLPLYPALALLAAAAMPGRGVARWLGLAALVLATAGLAAAMVAMPWLLDGAPDAIAIAAAAVMLALMTVAAWSWLAGRQRVALAAALAAAWAFYAGAYQRVLPGTEALWLSPRLVEATAAARPCADGRLIASGYSEPSLVFLAGTDTVLADGGAAAADLLLQEPCAVAVVEAAEQAAFLERLQEGGVAPAAVAEVAGWQYPRGNLARLTVYRITEPTQIGNQF